MWSTHSSSRAIWLPPSFCLIFYLHLYLLSSVCWVFWQPSHTSCLVPFLLYNRNRSLRDRRTVQISSSCFMPYKTHLTSLTVGRRHVSACSKTEHCIYSFLSALAYPGTFPIDTNLDNDIVEFTPKAKSNRSKNKLVDPCLSQDLFLGRKWLAKWKSSFRW